MSDPAPSVWSPPWIHTMTGRSTASTGVRTFTVKQSSLCFNGTSFSPVCITRRFHGGNPRPATSSLMKSSVCARRWNALGPGLRASRTSLHGSGGEGARHLLGPIGGATYGMPENTAIDRSASSRPRTDPDSVFASTDRPLTSIAAPSVPSQTPSTNLSWGDGRPSIRCHMGRPRR